MIGPFAADAPVPRAAAGVVMLLSVLVLGLAVATAPPLDAADTQSGEISQIGELAGTLAYGGPDASGRTWPLLVDAGGGTWLQPLAIYPAAALRWLGIGPLAAIRTAGLLAALLTIALTWVLAARVVGQWHGAAMAALLLLASPGLLINARAGGGDLTMLPPILWWLACVAAYGERPRLETMIAGGLILGLAMYTQPAGVPAVPVYFALGALALLLSPPCDGLLQPVRLSSRAGSASRAIPALTAAATGLVLSMLPLAVWFWRHPETYGDTFGRWGVIAPHLRFPPSGLLAFTNWDVMSRRASDAWHYLSPSVLFGASGLFGLAMAVFIPLGMMGRSGWRAPALHRLVAGGFLAAPLAAAVLDQPPRSTLVIALLPLGAILGAQGWSRLVTPPRLVPRLLAVALLLSLVVTAFWRV